MLLAAPNVSEGRDPGRIAAIESGFAVAADVLDVHVDADHNRTVITLAAERGDLSDGLIGGARAAIDSIDMRTHEGAHPAVGALDVCPVVWTSGADRGAAEAEARALAARIGGELGVPVFLYGALATRPERRERAFYRKGDRAELRRRMASGELRPDEGPREPHPSAGGTLVTARPPLAAFNVLLDTDDLEIVRAVAAPLREAGGGPPGLRAIGLVLSGGRGQVSMNVHDPIALPLGEVVEEVRRLSAPHGVRPIAAELVGLVPEAALRDYPTDVPIEGFDPDRHLIERRVSVQP